MLFLFSGPPTIYLNVSYKVYSELLTSISRLLRFCLLACQMHLGSSLLIIDVKVYSGVVLFLISLLARQPRKVLEASPPSQCRIKVVGCCAHCIFDSEISSFFLLTFGPSLMSVTVCLVSGREKTLLWGLEFPVLSVADVGPSDDPPRGARRWCCQVEVAELCWAGDPFKAVYVGTKLTYSVNPGELVSESYISILLPT